MASQKNGVTMLRAKAYAKANLSLNVVGTRNDYHTLDMLNVSFDLYDELTINFRDDHNVKIKVEADNISDFSPKLFAESIKRVLPILSENYNFQGIDIHLKKMIPPGGGFGGSSACSAAAARLIAKAAGIKPTVEHLLNLGSDVPFVYEGGSKRVQGIGEELLEVTLPEMFILAVKPNGGVFSRECFGTYDKIGTKGEANIDLLIDALNAGDLNAAQEYAYNQLSESSELLLPEISKVIKTLKNLGAEFVIMTGSGSGVVAIVKDREQGKKIQSALPKKWWSAVARTLSYGVEVI